MTKEDVYDFAYDVYVSQNYPVNNNKTEKYLDEFKFGQQMLWLKVYAFLIKEDHEKNIKEKNKVFYDEFLLGGK